MCGLTGFLSPRGFERGQALALVSKMGDRLSHRGPDESGTWLDAESGIAMAHRRLSVLDLSAAGHQPMVSGSGRYVLLFNGEIYNHLEIRNKIDALGQNAWKGHSDTETILSSIDIWGLERTLQKSVGMFALALWDKRERELSLARDRMGEKPLYYGWQGDTLLFGSELKALCAHPAFRADFDREVMPLYLHHGYIPGPWSVWRGIRKLMPGTIARVGGASVGKIPAEKPYWCLEEAVATGQADRFRGSDDEAIVALEEQLSVAVSGQTIADVPVGAFLSGGIDSSTVVALMQAHSSKRVKTFTIGFDEVGYNETFHANAVASHLNTDHTELYVSAKQAMDVVPKLATLYDEPFGDSSAIPTYLISQLARTKVTVALSGDGGDELFAGYSRYFNHKAERLWRTTRAMPANLRRLAVSALRSEPPKLADELLHRWAVKTTGRPLGKTLAATADLLAALTSCETREEFYGAMTSQWHLPPLAYQAGRNLRLPRSGPLCSSLARVEQMMVTDSRSYLPDDILVKVDRAAMAASLETRVPLLDHRVVEFAWRLPLSMKVRGDQGKWILREVLYRHVPRQIVDRPKMGFAVPVDRWLRGPLRDWAEDLLAEATLNDQGILNAGAIRARWHQHVQGRHNWRDSLWLVLMFQSWMRAAKI